PVLIENLNRHILGAGGVVGAREVRSNATCVDHSRDCENMIRWRGSGDLRTCDATQSQECENCQNRSLHFPVLPMPWVGASSRPSRLSRNPPCRVRFGRSVTENRVGGPPASSGKT